MGQIGFNINDYGGDKFDQNIDQTSWTGWQDTYVYTPLTDERVVSFNVRAKWASSGAFVPVVLYDITNPLAAIPVGDVVNFTALTTSYQDYSLPPVAEIILTAGTPYAIAFLSSSVGQDSSIQYGGTPAGGQLRQEAAASQTPPNPYVYTNSSNRTVGMYAITEPVTPSGPTLTGPDSTTDGTPTTATGDFPETINTLALVVGGWFCVQTIDSQDATKIDYVADSCINNCVPGTPADGIPLEATISAPGITPYVVQQKVDDGVNPPTTRDITLNAPATHDVIQTMIASANTIDDQSIFGASWIDVEDNMQATPPKQVDGVNFTWNADGTFTTDQDKTVNVRVPYFAPSTGQYGCINLTIQGSSIKPTGVNKNKRQSLTYQFYYNKNWRDKFQGGGE